MKKIILLVTCLFLLASCSRLQTGDEKKAVIKDVRVSVKIMDQSNEDRNYLVTISSDGGAPDVSEHAVPLPFTKMMITEKKVFTISLNEGRTYTINVSPTSFSSMEKYLKSKSESKSASGNIKHSSLSQLEKQITPNSNHNQLTLTIAE